MRKSLLLIAAFCSLNASAQIELVKKLGLFVDSMSVRGLDRRYIDAPEKPWQVIIQSNVNQSDLKMKAAIDGSTMFDTTWGNINWEPRVLTDITSYAGVWAGYRGYGVGYSTNVGGGDKGSIFKLGATGGAYGVNLRIHRFETDEPEIHMSGYIPDWYDETLKFYMKSPMNVRLLTLDAYYLFNGKRFSYAAAYDQSVIQKRSAGSLMAGAMYYHSTIAYDKGINADFILLMNDIGKMKQYQFSLGGGYAYNWVPCKGLLVSGMGMLMFTAYNRFDVWRYNSLLRMAAISEMEDPTPEEEIDVTDEDLEQYEKLILTVWPLEGNEKTVQHGRVIPVIDARLSVTYNLGNWFFNANAQLNKFKFKHTSLKGSLTDWYVNASVGIRL